MLILNVSPRSGGSGRTPDSSQRAIGRGTPGQVVEFRAKIDFPISRNETVSCTNSSGEEEKEEEGRGGDEDEAQPERDVEAHFSRRIPASSKMMPRRHR